MNYNAGGLVFNDIICINLKHRQDRKTTFKRDSRKKGFPFTFSHPDYDKQNPILGKWNAHLNAWKLALKHYGLNKKRNTKLPSYNILILEDDVRILTKKLCIPKPPSKWDMLYLGGNIQSAIDDEETNTSTVWKRVSCLMSHAYSLNITSVKTLLDKANAYLKTYNTGDNTTENTTGDNTKTLLPLDVWLCQHYHLEHLTYITTPEYIIQRDGFSDTKGQFVTYLQQLTSTHDSSSSSLQTTTSQSQLKKAETEIVNDQMILKLPNISDEELPHVTLVTPTRNNKSGFYFIIRNFYKLNYPKDKLTWIIIDDTDEDCKDTIKELIPGNDQRIKYITCKMSRGSFLSISKKINMALTYVSDPNELIAHFFDDQYYHESSLLSRVKTLIKYRALENTQCVGCTEFGLFDIVNNKSYIKYYPDSENNKTILHCSSLCYQWSWWKERPFEENRYVMESFFFVRNRLDKVIEIPFQYVSTQLTINTSNPSEADRYRTNNPSKRITNNDGPNSFAKFSTTDQSNFFDSWDTSTQNFILLMKETL